MAKAQVLAKARAKQDFDAKYSKCRKAAPRSHAREMRSVSDLLKGLNNAKSRKVRPNINKKMQVWARQHKWPAGSWAKDEACGSSKGGGTPGYAATYEALSDIYDELTC